MPAKSGVRIGRIFGIPIYLHASWVIIFVLITLSLEGQFSHEHPQWTPAQHWTLGILTSLLFFGSVLFHELSHSVVAIHYKIPVVSITLFVFGGVARISREPSRPVQEFNIAIAGPLASFFLAGVFYGLARIFPYSEMLGALVNWLGWINLQLALFNLVPGFPLDGGRVFRSIVWGITKNFSRATRVAVRMTTEGDQLTLEVEDNGLGMDRSEAHKAHSFGILGMQERALLLGGHVQIAGVEPHGTLVRLQIPLVRAADQTPVPAAS